MKRLFTLIAFATATVSSWAQIQFMFQQNKSNRFEIVKRLEALSPDKIVGTSSEQGHDQLDSVYFLNTKTYEFPYHDRWNMEAVDKMVVNFVKAYDADLIHHTGGYCYTSKLSNENPLESKSLQMYYGDGMAPLIVGGIGRNYIVLWMNDKKNPIYRHIKGLEWWLVETGNKNTPAVRIKTFELYGPQSEVQYMAAKKNNKVIEKAVSKTTVQLDGKPSLGLSSNEELLKGITVLSKLYTNKKDADMDRAVVRAINDRVLTYMGRSIEFDMEDWFKLFRVLRDIPGYNASVTFSDAEDSTLESDFYWLEGIYPMLNILCITHDLPGDTQCPASVNFRLRVVVNNENVNEISKLHPVRK